VKKCSKCLQIKSEKEFYFDTYRNGYESYCMDCKRKINLMRYYDNPTNDFTFVKAVLTKKLRSMQIDDDLKNRVMFGLLKLLENEDVLDKFIDLPKPKQKVIIPESD
jgi:hypothetical protein